MPTQNIWESLVLSEENLKTSYDYLISQVENFKKATNGELHLEIEVVPTISMDGKMRKMTLYYLLIVSPSLGGFRKKLLYIVEFKDKGRFPVNIWNEIENTVIEDITEDQLLDTLQKVLSRPQIKGTIEYLYKQSLESKKRRNQ